jgi:hypothetical protein
MMCLIKDINAKTDVKFIDKKELGERIDLIFYKRKKDNKIVIIGYLEKKGSQKVLLRKIRIKLQTFLDGLFTILPFIILVA